MRINRACVVALATLWLTALACASANVESSRNLVPESEVVKPSVVLVYDFAVSTKDVVVDTFGPEFATGAGPQAERDQAGADVANALAEAIVKELNERRIKAEHASRDMQPPLHALLLKGQFVAVDEGDQMKRVAIGFGSGKSEIQIRAQVYQATELGLRQLSEGEASAEGSKMPGMLMPVGIGAAAGTAATSAVVSGGMAVTREVTGALGKDIENLAEAIGERAEALYKRNRWL